MVDVHALIGPVTKGWGLTTTSSVTTLQLNNSSRSAAAMFAVPKDGTIDRIFVYRSAASGTPPAFKLSLETLDASGLPSGTDYGGSTGEEFTIAANGNWYTLADPATATAGDLICARIQPGATPPDGSNNLTVHTRHNGMIIGLPYAAEFSASWSKNASYPLLAVRYSDGTVTPIVPMNSASANSVLSSSFNSGTTPDEVGGLFTLPYGVTCFGCRFGCDPSTAGAQYRVRLYDAANNVLGTSGTQDYNAAADANLRSFDYFWDPVDLDAETTYRLAHEAISADGRQVLQITVPDADSKLALPDGDRWQRTERTNAGSWTETALVVPLVGLWISDVEAGGAGIARLVGGGLVH